MAAIAGRKALVKIPSAAVSFTDEATTHAGDGQTYQITNTAKRVWDPTLAVTVKVGGSVTGEVYTINRLTGTVTFATTNVSRAAVTVSGSYRPMSTAIESKSYSYQLTGKNDADNSFGDDWVTRVQVQKDVRGSLGRWFIDTYFSGALTADTPLVFQFFSDLSAASDLACWGRLTRRSLQLVHAGLQEEMLDFEGFLDADNRAIDLVTTTPDEISYLRGNLTGGDAAMLGFYSAARGITAVSSAVSQWDDARGGGFGPSLAQATAGKRPAWDAINLLMTFDGVDDELFSSAIAAFDLSLPISLVVIGTLQSSGAAANPAALANAAVTTLLGLRQAAGGGATILGQMNGGGFITVDSTIAIGTRRLMIVSSDGAATSTLGLDVPNHARVTNTTGQPISDTVALTVGNYQSGGSSPSPVIVRAVLVLSRQATVGDINTLKTWATTYHGAVLA